MNIILHGKTAVSCLTVNMFTTVILLVAIVFTGSKAHKNVADISPEKAQTLRDSAYKYAMGLPVLDEKKADPYYDTLFISKYLKKADYWFAGHVAAEVVNYTKCIAISSKMRKVKNDDEYDYSDHLPMVITPSQEYYEGLIHTKGFKKLWRHYLDYPLVHNLSGICLLLCKRSICCVNKYAAKSYCRVKEVSVFHFKVDTR